MRSIAWVALLRQIPTALQDNLVIVTGSGVELAVQAILRIEQEFVAVRGRLSGSTDNGRLFFIPFAQIDYVGFMREVREADYHQAFDTLQMPPLTEAVAEPAAVAPAAYVVPPFALEPEPSEPEMPSSAPASRIGMPIKSAVLERFRQRGPNGSLPGIRPSTNG